MYSKTEGIVLHGTKYGESGRIITAYTEAFGRTSFIVHGTHSKKSAGKANLLQPLFLLDLEIDHRNDRELHQVKELRIGYPYQTIPYDVIKSSQAIFLAEFLYRVLREEESRPELYQFLQHSFRIFDLIREGSANFHLSFLLQLSRYLGFAPVRNWGDGQPVFDLASGSFTGLPPAHPYHAGEAESRIIASLVNTPYEDIGKITLNAATRDQLIGMLIDYYSLHLGMKLKINSLEVLKELFS